MEFRRMNNGSVRCLISEEDMQEHGLEVTDFLNDRDKVHEFLGIVIEKAKEEVGYVNETGILSMQVMPLSKGRLSIIFSEKEDFTMLNEMKNMFDGGVSYEDLQNMLDDMNDEDDDEDEDDEDDFEDDDLCDELMRKINGFKDFVESDIESDKAGLFNKDDYWTKKDKMFEDKMNSCKDDIAKSKKDKKTNTTAIYEFSSLDNVMAYASNFSGESKVTSRLYRSRDKYYLVIEKGRLPKFCYDDICETALEYAERKKIPVGYMEYIQEHYKCIVKKNALNVLRSIVR